MPKEIPYRYTGPARRSLQPADQGGDVDGSP
jgi:hypothetical protein